MGSTLACATALLAATALPAFAQPTPAQSAADALLRQQERERVLREQQERTPDARLPQPEAPQGLERLPDSETDCVHIKGITLIGDSADSFQWAISHANQLADGSPDPATDRCLGTRGVNLVMRRIQNAIIARGFVAARVLAGPQSHLAEGRLELTLFPGRIRHIRFAPETDGRATQWNAVPARPGDLLNLRDIEQALENFKRVPGAESDIQIVPAEGPDAEPGQSDLIIQWRQGFPFRVNLSADDSGSRASGKYQGSVTVSYDHWWTLNDLFYISRSHDLGGGDPGARGTRGHTVHYSLPFGYWLLGFTASQNRYHQSVPGATQTYVYSGTSQNGEGKLSRLIYRDAVRKTTLSLKGWTRASKNFIDDTEVEVQRRRTAGVDVGVAHREFIGSATLDANLNYRRGTGAWNSLPAHEEAFGEGTSRPKIITADAQFNASFSPGNQRLRYTGAWRAQWNRTPLVPQDRFSIGSRYTVRGFDGENQLLAERGWLLRNDLGWALGQSGQELYVGADYGQVRGPSSGVLLGKHLSGAAIGLRGALKGFSYEVFAGRPISRPKGFKTSGRVAGFSANWSF
uniref:ShlB/FhaC/HecB family hemolysin secretion/activation protein n=2 Tax=Verminephrobacter aporrectodeae TaxID=1110389 RepID=UPI0038B2B575